MAVGAVRRVPALVRHGALQLASAPDHWAPWEQPCPSLEKLCSNGGLGLLLGLPGFRRDSRGVQRQRLPIPRKGTALSGVPFGSGQGGLQSARAQWVQRLWFRARCSVQCCSGSWALRGGSGGVGQRGCQRWSSSRGVSYDVTMTPAPREVALCGAALMAESHQEQRAVPGDTNCL